MSAVLIIRANRMYGNRLLECFLDLLHHIVFLYPHLTGELILLCYKAWKY